MSLLSATVSVSRYLIEEKIEGPLIETITQGLKKNTITDIDNEDMEQSVGWTSFDDPFKPDFEGSSFIIDNYFVFSLRIDRKKVQAKIIQKHYLLAIAERLSSTGKQYISRNEKAEIKEDVIQRLTKRIPATPNVYDLLWNYEASSLCFFSTQKAANEELETLFNKSFELHLIRLFPYTTAEYKADLTDEQRDALGKLSPFSFTE
ncbi:recombination-associated protein RdgC [Desulfococcaceae bacterium HSG9]|nr:recombination-associated protein RdgC [Desulfococcaceae bacterium HSG9]